VRHERVLILGAAGQTARAIATARTVNTRPRLVPAASPVHLDDPDAVRSYVQEFVVRGLAP